MPCEDCGHLLCVAKDDESLFCPRCNDLPVESDAVIQATTTWYLEDYFTDENILAIMEEYDKDNLILSILTRLNHVCNVFFEEEQTGIPVSDFGYLTYILKQIYEKDRSDFGDKQLDDPWDLDEELETLRDAYSMIIPRIRDAKNRFGICIKSDDHTLGLDNFTSDYRMLKSEYGICHDRCVESIICGSVENFEDYTFVADTLRSYDRPSWDEVHSSREFADCWYQYILQLRLMASSNSIINEAYYTDFPIEVDIFEIDDFFDNIDSHFTQHQHSQMKDKSIISALDPGTLRECGRDAFGKSWEEVRDYLIVSEENLDAHPFLFELETKEETKLPGGSQTHQVPSKIIFYPRLFARMLKFQVFSLLKNGSEPTSHKLLSNMTSKRGKMYERNMYEYLIDQEIECYHGAEIKRSDRNEIDLLCICKDSLLFVEIKYFMPPININGPEGMRVLNEKFDLEIFNEESESSNREAEGKTFLEKVEAWKGLSDGDKFTSQAGIDRNNREEQVFREDWNNLDIKTYVVSNVVPSYVVKEGVRFLTDLEFYRHIEHGDEDMFYSLP